MLRSWTRQTSSSWLTVLYGRRRIGKTRLVEESFKEAILLEFEGLGGQPSKVQKRMFLDCLAEIRGKREYRMIAGVDWTEILTLLSDAISQRYKKKPVVVLFDEFQWMAAGRTQLISSLKYVWDKHFLKNNRVHLIICGSVCSFIVKKVVGSKALYGRIDLEINLQPLGLPEIREVFRPRRSIRDVVELYMAIGGVPRYLEMIDPTRSVRANLERLCFSRNGYLVGELERIFASHFGTSNHYRIILKTLAKRAFATRQDLQKACKLASGGRMSEYLDDLELAGFVERYAPVDKPSADRLGFGAVNYDHGSWFERGPNGMQVDLVFVRADRVISLCELKYQEGKIGKGVIAEVERKRVALPNLRGYTIETILITACAPTQDLEQESYFHRVLRLEDLFG